MSSRIWDSAPYKYALDVPCPTCSAGIGERCYAPASGNPAPFPHSRRNGAVIEAWQHGWRDGSQRGRQQGRWEIRSAQLRAAGMGWEAVTATVEREEAARKAAAS